MRSKLHPTHRWKRLPPISVVVPSWCSKQRVGEVILPNTTLGPSPKLLFSQRKSALPHPNFQLHPSYLTHIFERIFISSRLETTIDNTVSCFLLFILPHSVLWISMMHHDLFQMIYNTSLYLCAQSQLLHMNHSLHSNCIVPKVCLHFHHNGDDSLYGDAD